MLKSSVNGNVERFVKHMSFAKIVKKASSSLLDRCCRYEQFGSGQPRLEDMQRRWIEVWAGVAH